MTIEFDLDLGDGHTLHAYDVGGAGGLAVFWHHGTPNVGAPPKPLFETGGRLGIRWLSYDRPGYGGSTRRPGRNVASAAVYAAAVADALGIATFGVMGHSGGGPHALACAALLPERVLGAVSVSGLAPYGVPDLDWFGGMNDSGIASLHAALQGLEAKERFETSGAEYDPEFTPADLAALSGPWSWLGEVVGPATDHGPGGLVDDDISYVTPWGFNPTQTGTPCCSSTAALTASSPPRTPSGSPAASGAQLRGPGTRMAPQRRGGRRSVGQLPFDGARTTSPEHCHAAMRLSGTAIRRAHNRSICSLSSARGAPSRRCMAAP